MVTSVQAWDGDIHVQGGCLVPLIMTVLAWVLWTSLPAPPPRYQVTSNKQDPLHIRLRPLERARGPLHVRASLSPDGTRQRRTLTPQVSVEGTITLEVPPSARALCFEVRRAGPFGRLADLLQPGAIQHIYANVQPTP